VKGRTAIEPQPWWQVGLAILPGAVLFLSVNLDDFGWQVRLPGSLALSVFVLLAVSSFVWAAVRRRVFGVAAWGLFPLGFLAALGLFEVTGTHSTYLVLVAVGLLLVRYSRLCAGLFVLAGGVLLVSSHIEPAVFLWDSPFWNAFSDVSLTVLFFILTPVWVLRARSIHGQVAGLLLPTAVYFAVVVSALSAARGFPIAKSVSISSPTLVLFATIAAAVALYGTVSSRLVAHEM
jgi:hypothetical protein